MRLIKFFVFGLSFRLSTIILALPTGISNFNSSCSASQVPALVD